MAGRSVLVCLAAIAALACGAPLDVPAPEPVDLRAVYDRTDIDFDSAVMFRPDDATANLEAHRMAPLLLVRNGVAGSVPPKMTYEKTGDGWIYRWVDPSTGRAQGIHARLGDDGFALAYEALAHSAGARLLFVEESLEQQAVERYDGRLTDRRYAIERGVDETPGVAVGALFEPGSEPLGPFVYLWEDTYDVNLVLCRCMAPRVYDIVDSIAYELTPYEAAPPGLEDWTARPLEELLRLP